MDEPSLLEQLDKIAPLKEFDAFPKVQTSYKSRSLGGGLLTIFVAFLSFFLILNDIGDFFWGWNDYEFSVDRDLYSALQVNVDIIVKMPCGVLSVDMKDALGDRLELSQGFTRDGTLFDIGQAEKLDAHARAMSASEVTTSARHSRGFFSFFSSSSKHKFKPTYNIVADASACRIYGSIHVKKVTANLHITTMGHGYPGKGHVDHSQMNLSHIINEFSFGPFFPDIVQPLDNTLEIAREAFPIYQYFITVVPTTYHAARSWPLRTNQYSVTHYNREVIHNKGTPGIFFKFDMEPLALHIYQRTTSLYQFLVRVIGVIGGVWVCFGWGVKVGSHAAKAVGITFGEDDDSIVADASSTKKRWGGGSLRARTNRAGSGQWTNDGGSAYSSYQNTPNVPYFANSGPTTPASPGFRVTNGLRSPYPTAPPHSAGPRSQSPYNSPHPTPGLQSNFPASPAPHSPSFGSQLPPPPHSPAPSSPGFPRSPMGQGFPSSPSFVGQGLPPQGPPPRQSGLRSVDDKKAQ